MGCGNSTAPAVVDTPKPITLGPSAAATGSGAPLPSVAPVAGAGAGAVPERTTAALQPAAAQPFEQQAPSDAQPSSGAAPPSPAIAGPVEAVGVALVPGADSPLPVVSAVVSEFITEAPVAAPAVGKSTVTSNPGAGALSRLSAGLGVAIPRNKEELKGAVQKATDAVGGIADAVSADAKKLLVGQMESALASSDNKRVNSILDSAMAGSALGNNAPDVMRKAANQAAASQLKDAIASEDPKQLKGALVAAKRLNATSVPEFNEAIQKYKTVKKLPAGWDVKNMVLQRRGDKMVAKMDVGDPLVQAKFQHLLDLTHRKVYTRDRQGGTVPDKLELVSVTTITNEDLWGDYMARRETLRREIEADPSFFRKTTVDTQTPGDSKPSAATIASSLAEDFAEPLLAEVNEVFLFHGTSASAADSITTGNFKVNLAGSNAGTLYGRGVYLAENATKSDEYTRPAGTDALRYLLLCRTLLGRVHYTDTIETDPRECEEACLRGCFHSVLGDRKKCRGTFREFVVFDEDQVYANYILAYRRVDGPAPAAPPAPVAPAPASMPVAAVVRSMEVICPPGVAPGAPVQTRSPEGLVLQVLLPPGVSAGQKFVVQY